MSSIHSRACPPGRRSFVQLWFAVLALMLLGFVGLAIDAGYMVFAGNQLHGAA